MYGASPRASINMIITARSLAFVRGRKYVVPQDVTDMAIDVMQHRLVLSYEAMSDEITSTMIIKKILEKIPVPAQPLQTHVKIDNESEKILQRLDWTVIRRLDGLLQGDYRTLFLGFGLDLADLRGIPVQR